MFDKLFTIFGPRGLEPYNKVARKSIYDMFNGYSLHYQVRFKSTSKFVVLVLALVVLTTCTSK